MPSLVAVGLVALFLVLQIAGELMEFFGKAAPSFMKIRKFFAKKSEERRKYRKTVDEATTALKKNNELYTDILSHYNKDSIAKRDAWMHAVDSDREKVRALEELLLKVRSDVLQIRIEAMRNEIISFASRISNDSYLVTREECNRIFRLYSDYEKILADNEMENGEIDINYQIIKDSYDHRMRHGAFLEDKRGYNG